MNFTELGYSGRADLAKKATDPKLLDMLLHFEMRDLNNTGTGTGIISEILENECIEIKTLLEYAQHCETFLNSVRTSSMMQNDLIRILNMLVKRKRQGVQIGINQHRLAELGKAAGIDNLKLVRLLSGESASSLGLFGML